jgi:hypothetical protein
MILSKNNQIITEEKKEKELDRHNQIIKLKERQKQHDITIKQLLEEILL